jgi:acetyl esterase/lipase
MSRFSATVTRPPTDGHTTLRLGIYRPTSLEAQTPVLLWIHGDGYLIGRPKEDDDSYAYYVRELGWTMIPLDYRLVPKYPFPAALDDCYSALLWAASHSAQLGIDPQRIAIRDAGAGCGLVAALAQSAHDRWEIDPVLQMLVYPMLDDRITHENPCFRH